jgi:programmed cell death 6-interacting protein
MPSALHIMLAVHCKRTDAVDLKPPILAYVRSTYSDAEAEEAADDLAAVQALRAELVAAQSSATGAPKREALLKYYRALANIETRFPISGERGHVKLSFPWTDAFRPTKRASQANVHFEKAAILFNLGAVMSQQALQVERGSADGLTAACKLFQEAAGVFAHLREAEANKVDAPPPVDLSGECLTMMEKLMLAQAQVRTRVHGGLRVGASKQPLLFALLLAMHAHAACSDQKCINTTHTTTPCPPPTPYHHCGSQECVYHKAVLDGKSPGTSARLAKQAAVMYHEVSALFASPALSAHFERSWAAHSQMKGSLMDVLALVEAAKQLNAETKISKEIATLSEAFTRLQATKKLAKAASQELADSLRPLEESTALALRKAQKDNDAVYLERVPPFADLPPVQGALLVKPAPPQGLDAGGEALFSSLVPDSRCVCCCCCAVVGVVELLRCVFCLRPVSARSFNECNHKQTTHSKNQRHQTAPRPCPSTPTWSTRPCARRSTSSPARPTRRASRCGRCVRVQRRQGLRLFRFWLRVRVL